MQDSLRPIGAAMLGWRHLPVSEGGSRVAGGEHHGARRRARRTYARTTARADTPGQRLRVSGRRRVSEPAPRASSDRVESGTCHSGCGFARTYGEVCNQSVIHSSVADAYPHAQADANGNWHFNVDRYSDPNAGRNARAGRHTVNAR